MSPYLSDAGLRFSSFTTALPCPAIGTAELHVTNGLTLVLYSYSILRIRGVELDDL